jgi:hypothetical protein
MDPLERTRHEFTKLAHLILGVLICTVAAAEPLEVGGTLLAFDIEDQHGTPHRVDESISLILFSRDMDGGKLLTSAMEGHDAAFLQERRAVSVADISGMPRLVARLFALPKMRRRPYPVLLDRDGTLTANLPDREGVATLIFLDRLVMVRVEHLSSVEAIRQELEGAASADPPSDPPEPD